ncbi:MAG: fluoride efflux transporter CrcB [Pseudomonadota bacterium]|nr:fluoride efflux transporter CrcB [Pseudomonadota bacterium]
MMQWLVIAGGGALGAMARFGVVRLSAAMFGPGFPLGTLIVNVLGSLVAGVLYVRLVEASTGGADSMLRSLLVVGFLGAFTTFSAFSVDTLQLLEKTGAAAAGWNVLLNVVLCLAACAMGFWIGRQIFTA